MPTFYNPSDHNNHKSPRRQLPREVRSQQTARQDKSFGKLPPASVPKRIKNGASQ